ncbi:hypothetical protein ROZALSC1DRAFT_27525 [Rozella allomycis CSF55]|uniref:Mitochondrial distribution and morphology protein family 31/32 domain-containing protein n=1 Tax=Rozella allomycis (strain CSF55) TaxID=988480 RepID=A0A075B218_ROZAC|nr:Mitochondrial distribution and morphology protein family 31/32 domain-containing protein [Rozella allomycis CSF55]RKP21026.1 hypothetical protein ROZALSC1DRAFT_27525 [Rozella allomycis CSF55]|eukprot:EPZ35016.1 Mitochondrial distribution and morphology protein family 31/32 domain-containing protein [Rozella allomycis CSF55]
MFGIFVGTVAYFTDINTFASVLVSAGNFLDYDLALRNLIADSLSKRCGCEVSIESSIVPRWGERKIQLSNIHIKKNPLKKEDGMSDNEYNKLNNFTKYNVFIETFEFSLSLSRLLTGESFIKSCTISGMRGEIGLDWEGWIPERLKPNQIDLDIKNVVLKDCKFTLLYDNFRPYNVYIISSNLPRLRPQWLMYDILNAESIVGMYENSLFSMYAPQFGLINNQTKESIEYKNIRHLKIDGIPIDHFTWNALPPFGWVREGSVDVSCVIQLPLSEREILSEESVNNIKQTIYSWHQKILNKDSVEDSENVILEWFLQSEISKGLKHYEDLFSKSMFAIKLNEYISKNEILLEKTRMMYDKSKEWLLTHNWFSDGSIDHEIPFTDPQRFEPKRDSIGFQFDFKFKNLKASVPMNNDVLNPFQNALLQPIIGYMNIHNVNLPVSCHFSMSIDNFNGGLTLYDTELIPTTADQLTLSMTAIMEREKEKMIQWKMANVANFFQQLFSPKKVQLMT